MAITDGNGMSLAARIECASPAEVTLFHDTLDSRWVWGMLTRMLGDKAYDSDKLDAELAKRGVIMMCSNKVNRIKRTQDGRSLRRYKRRWRVEGGFAWLNQLRRTVTQWEMYAFSF